MLRVFVVYRPTEDGQRAVRFAASIARASGELHLLLPVGPFEAMERTRLLAQVGRWTDVPPSLIGWASGEDGQFLHVGDPEQYAFGDAIVVDDALIGRRDITAVAPRFESGLFARGKGPALMPIGNRSSSRRTIEIGLPLLRALGFDEVGFYHTTWRADGVDSDDPSDHVNAAARDMLAYARDRAAALSLRSSEVIRTDAKVSDGIKAAALERQSPLILMAHSFERVGITYVDETVDDSPTPVLAIGRNAEAM